MKPIKGFETKYAVTEDGRVFSLLRFDQFGRSFGGVYLKPKPDRYGYLVVHLTTCDRKATTKTVHRLVAEAYIPNWEEYPVVNHKDGNKLNNNVTNLEWTTHKKNTQHAWSLGLCRTYDRKLPYNRQGIIDSNQRRRRSDGI